MKIFLIGFMGSGKTSSGKRLAKQLNLEFIDLDQAIEKRFKISITNIFEIFGERIFRNLESHMLKSIITEKDNFVLSCGGGTPCFNENIELINNSGISIYIKMSEKSLMDRLQKSQKKRPLLSNLTDDEFLKKISELLNNREPYYNQAAHIVNGINLNIKTLIDKIYK